LEANSQNLKEVLSLRSKYQLYVSKKDFDTLFKKLTTILGAGRKSVKTKKNSFKAL